MFLAMGVGAYAGGIFHLHARVFQGAAVRSGAVSHALAGEQTAQCGRAGRTADHLHILICTGSRCRSAARGLSSKRDPLEDFARQQRALADRGRSVSHGHAYVPTPIYGVLGRGGPEGMPEATVTTEAMEELLRARSGGARRTERSTQVAPRQPFHDAPSPMATALIALAIGSSSPAIVPLRSAREHHEQFLETVRRGHEPTTQALAAGEVEGRPDVNRSRFDGPLHAGGARRLQHDDGFKAADC